MPEKTILDQNSKPQVNQDVPRVEVAAIADATVMFSDASSSVLPALGNAPRVMLRDEADGAAEPVVQATSSELPATHRESRYQLFGEIARGGMGAILKGRDNDLGRDLAIKVLLESHKDKPEVLQRFVEEAQISGQLQHPGIVPVYELGQFADQRPFFSMKLVKGQTLAALLAERKTPSDERTRFLGIYQQICQTLAYSHSRGVIHRDLKPANIMVGAFGEVQVMDWGLAKVLGVGGVADEKKAIQKQQDVSVIRTVQRGSSGSAPIVGSHTLAGSVMGTPAYMAPEQALGEIDRLDERADVFGLGAILCEILTGKPPYLGQDGTEVFRRATRGKLDDCHARLEACEADRELVDLAKECLSVEPDQRPRNAGAVAEKISSYLASVESRLRATEVERASEAARAEEALHTVAEHEAATRAERRARRLQLGLAVVFVGVTTIGGLAATWAAMYQSQLKQDAQLAERNAVVAREAESKQLLQTEAEKTRAESEKTRAETEKSRAESEKTRADIMVADMQTARGLLAGERKAPAEAALWFATAAEQSAAAGEKMRAETNRLRAQNWLREATIPVAVMSLGGYPRQLEFQPGGDLLLSRSDQRLFLWSWRDGKLLTWADELKNVASACFHPTGSNVAIGFMSGQVQILSLPGGERLQQIPHTGSVQALAFSADGRYLAIGSYSMRIWDTQEQTFLGSEISHPKQVIALAFSPKGDRVVSSCDDKLARVFAVTGDKESSTPLFAPLPHTPEVASPPVLVDDGKTLVTISAKYQLTRTDMANGRPKQPPTIQVKPWGVPSVVSSPDGNWIAIGGYYGPEVHHAVDVSRPPLHLGHTNLVKKYAFSPDSTMLLSVSWDQTARIWSLLDGQSVTQPLPHMGNVENCAWSSDATHVATAQSDGLIRVWQRPTDELVKARESNWGGKPRISFDGQLVAPGYWHEGPFGFRHQGIRNLHILSATTGRPAGAAIALPGDLVESCICGDNRSAAALWIRESGGFLGVWDVTTARALFEPIALPGIPLSVAARPGSNELAVLCATGNLLVVDHHTGKVTYQSRHDGWVWTNEPKPQVQYTPDGKTLVALGAGNTAGIDVRDAATGKLRFPRVSVGLEGGNFLRSFSLSADSRMLATMVNGKNAVQVWDLATGKALSQPLPHPGDSYGLFSVTFSPDGKRLLTGSKDGQVRYWDWQAGKLACPPMTHSDEAYDVLITPDGRFALTTVRKQPWLQVWELTTGRRIASPIGLGGKEGDSSNTQAITPDGRHALVCYGTAELAIVGLEPLLAPSPTPSADLAHLAELATAQRIELGDLSGLSSEQWQERWNLLKQTNSQLVANHATRAAPLKARLEDPRLAAMHSASGNQYATQGQWTQSAKAGLAEVAANPGDRTVWATAAVRLVLASDAEEYRKLCARMLDEFGGAPSVEQADSLSKACLLLPDAVDRTKLPMKLLANSLEKNTVPVGFHPWGYATLSLIAYRNGDFEQAIRWGEKSFEFNDRKGHTGGMALTVMAMAQQRLQKNDEARKSLAEATSLMPFELATLGSKDYQGGLPVSIGVIAADGLINEILRREAALLIHNDVRRPPDAASMRASGDHMASLGKWAEAAQIAQAEIEATRTDRIIWSKAAARMVLAMDEKGYRELCGRMLEQFSATTVPEQADSVCKTCLLLPKSVDRSKLPVKILQDALENKAGPEWLPSWGYGGLALVAYRDGDFKQAILWSEKSFEFNQKQNTSGALALVVLAMAQHQLQQGSESRRSLAEATALIPFQLETLGSKAHQGTLPVSSSVVGLDWLIAEVLRREASLLIYKDARRPSNSATLRSRGMELYNQGRLADAQVALQQASELEPRHAWTHNLLGLIQLQQDNLNEAMVEFRRANEFAPDYAPAFLNLGFALYLQGKQEEAVVPLRKAVQFEPRLALAHRLLGQILFEQGKLDEAIASLNKALELDPQDPISPELLKKAKWMQPLLDKLDLFIEGKLEPADNGQRLDLALLSFERKRFAASARFFAEALAKDPKLADDPMKGNRYNAACAALRASSGEGDAGKLADAERTRLRQQAAAWLRAELDNINKQFAESGPQDRQRLLVTLVNWISDPDLASLRDPKLVAKMPEEEQKENKSLWSDLEAALSRTP